MSDWLKILLSIIVILLLFAVAGVGIYLGYKRLNKPGTCSFVTYTPSTLSPQDVPSGLMQAGYISCGGGGGLWKPSSMTITNKGPGTFYIGPLPSYSTPQELDTGNSLTVNLSGGVSPNVYYQQNSQYTNPNLIIT